MNRIAVVTGASSGIGHAAALALADRGVDCIVTYRRNGQGANDLVRQFRQHGRKAVALHLDLARSDTYGAFRNEVGLALAQEWGSDRLDYLVNNAGFGGTALFEDTTEEMFDGFMRTLLKGPYFLTQGLLGLMRDRGAIVNVTSNAPGAGLEDGYTAYAAMKGGLAALTRAMAREFSRRGIRVNAVAPGPTRTRIGDGAFDRHPEVVPVYAARTALGRLGEGADIGRVIAALLSEDFGWVTGQELEVSGGYRL